MLYEVVSGRGRRAALVTFVCSLFAALATLHSLADTLTLAWDASTDPTVVGYNVYYGVASRTYTNMINVGDVTTVTISNLVPGVTYYFAATTYNAAGLESDYSTELSYTVPAAANAQPTLNVIASLSINENAGLQTVSLTGISSGSTNETQTLTVTAISSNTALIPNPTVSYTSPNTTGSLTFTPVTNGNGSATITVTVNDGGATNNTVSQTFTVTVDSVNNQPTLNTIANVTVNENSGAKTVSFNGVTSGATNEVQTLTVTATSSNTGLIPNPTVTYTSPATNGTLTLTPATNGYGSATITVTVNDGGASNNTVTRTFTVTVAAVNQPPTLNTLASVSYNENSGPQTLSFNGVTSGATNEVQTLAVTATSSNTGLIPNPTVTYTSPATNGTLTLTPVTNATGSATITVTVNDGGASNNTVSRTFTVTVAAVNQPPTLNAIANVSFNENTASRAVSFNGVTSGATNESQTLTVTATSSNTALIPNPTVTYASPATNGTLTLYPVTNTFGSATITVTVNDGGATNNTVTRTFTVTVNPVNQPPTLDAIANLTIIPTNATQTVNLTGISSGAANESQTLTVTATSSNTSVLPNPSVTYTSPNTTGTLTLSPATNASGSSLITVTVNDGGASNNTVTRTFTVTVDQPPTISALTNLVIASSSSTPALPFTIGDYETAASNLTVSATSDNLTLVPTNAIAFGGSDSNRTVTITPSTGTTGLVNITITVSDGLATASSSFQLSVQDRPAAPSNFRISVSGSGTISGLSSDTMTVGTTYTLTALPAAGQQFTGWSGSITSSDQTLTFVMTPNLVLQASFSPATFTAQVATYNGLFYQQDPSQDLDLVQQTNSGSFTLATTKAGKYSGRLQIGSTRYSFSGVFDTNGQGTNIIHRRGATDLALAFHLGLGAQSDQAFGQLSDGTWSNNLIYADRCLFNSRTNPAPQAGTYTLILPGYDGAPNLPAGDGFGSVRVSKSGQVSLAGTLADGTHFSQSVPLSAQGNWPLYVPLYSGKGSVLSWLSFASTDTNDIQGALSWIKPADSRSHYYPNGFATNCFAEGSIYVHTSSADPVLQLSTANVTFSGGDLTPSFTNSTTMLVSSVVNHSPNRLGMSLSTSTGVFHGTVTDPTTGKSHSFSGAAFQKNNTGYGLLLGTSQSSRVVVAD